MRGVPRRKRERIREGRRRRRSARKTIDKSVSTARIPIASSYAARLTRCLYRGMYNNRLRRWHRCPFVSVGGHLGFSSRGRIRELDRGKAAREKRERDEELLDGRCARFEREAEEKIRMCMRSAKELGRWCFNRNRWWSRANSKLTFCHDYRDTWDSRFWKEFREKRRDHARRNGRDRINGVHGEERRFAFHVGLYDLFTRIALDAMGTRPSWQASTTVPNSDPRLIVVGSRSPITRSSRYHTGTVNDNDSITFFDNRLFENDVRFDRKKIPRGYSSSQRPQDQRISY